MATQRPRNRRHSAAVYRRRRLVLLLLIVVIAALVWLFIAQPWKGAAAPSGTPSTPATSASPSATSSGDASDQPTDEPSASSTEDESQGILTCDPNALKVEALTDKSEYAANELPKLSIALTNTGAVDCTTNVGTTTQKFTITSGDDVWWRSTDCQSDPSDMEITLHAGQRVESASSLEWDRTRSSVDTCDQENRAQAPAGGASYHLSVEIAGAKSTDSAQFLLN